MATSRITSTGIIQDATHKAHAGLTEYNGRHLWTVLALFAVSNPARSQHDLDTENLLTIEGPGCLHCEQVWRPDIGSKCPGEPTEPTP